DGVRDRVSLQAVLDATERRLLPGDTLYYHVRVTDNSPGGQVGVSETYRLRLPSMTELRRQADEEAASLVDEAESLARSARELGEATRDLRRRSSTAGGSGSGQSGRSTAREIGRA